MGHLLEYFTLIRELSNLPQPSERGAKGVTSHNSYLNFHKCAKVGELGEVLQAAVNTVPWPKLSCPKTTSARMQAFMAQNLDHPDIQAAAETVLSKWMLANEARSRRASSSVPYACALPRESAPCAAAPLGHL